MAAMDCPAGVIYRHWMPEIFIEGFAGDGSSIKLPFVGFAFKSVVDRYVGEFINVIATRISNSPGSECYNWRTLLPHQYVLAWKTVKSTIAPGRVVVIGLTNEQGWPIVTPEY
ncbi:hypothetical protein [Cellvibrio mixtus]|uniref:hypothetical protein n=1 Tax=Cellvibrio mixtus TaxID=39650 RepID=UPI000587A253|nr:hypothetical protein [Cellvibrio mixtus]